MCPTLPAWVPMCPTLPAWVPMCPTLPAWVPMGPQTYGSPHPPGCPTRMHALISMFDLTRMGALTCMDVSHAQMPLPAWLPCPEHV
eukprot:350742-Chlamydomonas_euryale.AAC.20